MGKGGGNPYLKPRIPGPKNGERRSRRGPNGGVLTKRNQNGVKKKNKKRKNIGKPSVWEENHERHNNALRNLSRLPTQSYEKSRKRENDGGSLWNMTGTKDPLKM